MLTSTLPLAYTNLGQILDDCYTKSVYKFNIQYFKE